MKADVTVTTLSENCQEVDVLGSYIARVYVTNGVNLCCQTYFGFYHV